VNNIIDLGAIENQYGLSVGENEADSFNIYPNPFDNQLIVKMDGVMEIEAFNSMGQKIISVEAQDEITIDTSDWDGGVYFIKLNGKTLKVLK